MELMKLHIIIALFAVGWQAEALNCDSYLKVRCPSNESICEDMLTSSNSPDERNETCPENAISCVKITATARSTADIRVTAHFEEAKCSLILEKITPGCYTKKQLPDDESLTIDETLQSFNLTLESVEVCYNCGYGLYVTTAIMLPFLLLLGNL
ncbi:uncharacterized protein [Apostichopus japonicus]|uniref:uncharacterized protein n=1 Tax=Stichopus japonicus TaxID=307972 RepID=UPI003AB6E035